MRSFLLKVYLGLVVLIYGLFKLKVRAGHKVKAGIIIHTLDTSMPWWNHKMHILSIYVEIRFVFVDLLFLYYYLELSSCSCNDFPQDQ